MGLGPSLPPAELARQDSALSGKSNVYFLLRRMQNSWWLAHLSKGEEVRVEMELIEMMLASVL